MLAGILLRFGLPQAFGTLNGEFVMCGGILAWLLFKVFAAPAVIAAMVMGNNGGAHP